MAKNTSVLLGDYFENFINSQIESGRYYSTSKVVRAAAHGLFEQEQTQKNELIKELKKGEKSKFLQKFDHKKFIAGLHSKHLNDAV